MLRNIDIKYLTNECDYYQDEHEYPNYIKSWRTNLNYPYSRNKKCRQLEEIRLMNTSFQRDNIFNYKNNRSRSRRENFNHNHYIKKNNNITSYILIILLIIITIINMNLK